MFWTTQQLLAASLTVAVVCAAATDVAEALNFVTNEERWQIQAYFVAVSTASIALVGFLTGAGV